MGNGTKLSKQRCHSALSDALHLLHSSWFSRRLCICSLMSHVSSPCGCLTCLRASKMALHVYVRAAETPLNDYSRKCLGGTVGPDPAFGCFLY